jgi:hypothetical protein
MSKMDWRKVVVGSMMGVFLVGCSQGGSSTRSGGGMVTTAGDARSFQGTIISLRPTTSEMMISKDERVGRDAIPNVVRVKYDADTQFYLDNQPTTLDRIEQYMNVSIQGRMREGNLVAQEARFSSVLPANVRRASERIEK